MAYPETPLSVSQIETFLRCPRQYQYRYVERQPEVYTYALAEGKTLAKILEFGFQCNWCTAFNEDLTFRELWGHYRKFWNGEKRKISAKEKEAFKQSNVSEKDLVYRMEVFTQRILEHRKRWVPSLINDKPAVEHKIEGVIGGVPILGFADLVTADAVVDFKCAGSTRNYDPKHSIQLAVYCVLLGRKTGRFEVFEKRTGELVTLEGNFNLKRKLRWLKILVPAVAKAIESRNFPPCNPQHNALCDPRWCSFWSQCYGKYQ